MKQIIFTFLIFTLAIMVSGTLMAQVNAKQGSQMLQERLNAATQHKLELQQTPTKTPKSIEERIPTPVVWTPKKGVNNNPKSIESLCAPDYFIGCDNGHGITDFAVEEIQNYNNGCANLNVIGWSEYYDLGPAILTPGFIHTFTVGSGYSTQFVNIWIDFNDDGDLTPDEMILNNYPAILQNELYNIDITIPTNATPGDHAMRVMDVYASYFTDPCGSYPYGEAEDYTVTIISPTFGELEGYITENTGGAAIEGALVSLSNGLSTAITDASGYYYMDSIAEALWTATVSKDNCQPATMDITIVEDQMTTQDFQLIAPSSIEGYVKELSSGNVIEGVLIDINNGAYTSYSDVSGYYSFDEVLTETWNVAVVKEGYAPINTTITIEELVLLELDFLMTAPTMDITPTAINIVIDPNAQLTEYIEIANNGDATLEWNTQIEFLPDNPESWLDTNPSAGNVEAGEVDQIEVYFDAEDYVMGTVKAANIRFNSDPNVGSVTVPVTMTIGNLDFGHITGNVYLDGIDPYNSIDITEVVVGVGAYTAHPDANGDYDITAYPGTYDVKATQYGYTQQIITGVVVDEGVTVSGIDFILPCINGKLFGAVTDDFTGDPIKNVTISVLGSDMEVLAEGLTANDGTYEFFVEAGTYDVQADHPSYVAKISTDVVIEMQMDTQSDFQLVHSCVFCDAKGLGETYLDGVEFETISNLGTGYISGYENYTNMKATVIPGLSYELTIYQGGITYPGNDFGVWIDWNLDGTFDPVTENVVCGIAMGGLGGIPNINTWEISIPIDATPGRTTMRIRMKMSGVDCGDPCGTTLYGEVEDYTVLVQGLLDADFTSDVTQGCEELTVNYTDNSYGDIISWDWNFEGGDPSTSTIPNPTVFYATPGVYNTTLIVSDGTTTNTSSQSYYISVFELPEVTFAEIYNMCINWPAYELTEGEPAGGEYTGTGVENGWFYPEVAGFGTHELTYTYVNNACVNSAEQTVYVDECVGVNGPEIESTINIYPNPSTGSLTLKIYANEQVNLKLTNIIGEVVYKIDNLKVNGFYSKVIDLNYLTEGVYLLRLEGNTLKTSEKIVISR